MDEKKPDSGRRPGSGKPGKRPAAERTGRSDDSSPERTPDKVSVDSRAEDASGKPAPSSGGKAGTPSGPSKPAEAGVRRPPKARGPVFEDLEQDPLLQALQQRFGAERVSGQSFLEQKIYTVELDILYDGMSFLRDQPDWEFDYLIDLTALDHLGEEKRFCMVYQLYSYRHGQLIRVKSRLTPDEVVPSVVSIWKAADWLEREVYDMFGIEFSEHPDLKRILLPDDWHGFPLRKDYDIKLQDQAWIRKHLRIRKVPC